ncbi:MAG: class I SAM-dependent methyltransferase [Isosphaeraceae bacterium]|nr:class I SAM-dependent methyltransferase [Isosphaeraceae bacterium]
MPLPESVAQHYDVLPTRYWSESYFTIAPNYVVYQVDGFRQMTGREPRGSIALDIGAGIGKAMVALERSGFETHGIEPSASFRQAALERFEISEDRLRLSSIEDADYPDGMFDFINFTAVLEHLPDPAAILRKTTRWLKPDGVMLVDVPSSSFLLSKLIRLFYHLTGNNFVINTCPMHVPYHLYEFGVESFRRNSRLGGYSVIHVDPNPCAEFVPRMLRPLSERVMRRTWTGMQLLVWLKRQ